MFTNKSVVPNQGEFPPRKNYMISAGIGTTDWQVQTAGIYIYLLADRAEVIPSSAKTC